MEILPAFSTDTRIKAAMEQISELRNICGVPSISIGVLHHGEVIHMESFGLRDVENNLPADSKTLYLLSSLSKGFVASAIGGAVAEGKMDWKTPLSYYVPEFEPSDPDVNKANLIDFLRHSSGLSSPQLLIIGPQGMLIHSEKDFVQLMNTCPAYDENGNRYNRSWLYNNWGYGLVATALQRAYQRPYADIIQNRILMPLGLSRTIVSGSSLASESNIAYPYALLDDGAFRRLESDRWTYQNHTPANAAMGMRSCVEDMLSWASNILKAEHNERIDRIFTTSSGNDDTVLYNVHQTRKGRWTRPSSSNDDLTNSTVYCMGWYRTIIPSSMLGFLSYNDMTREESTGGFHNPMIGVESPEKEVVAHNGVFCGSTSALYTFRDTQSAIIAFANGLQDADASEFAVQIITQALFDLKPKVDILKLARREVNLRKRHFAESLLSEWERNRDTATPEAPREQYVGDFEGHTTCLSILHSGKTAELSVRFNGIEESTLKLQYYRKDTYSFFPTFRNDWLTKSMIEWNDHRLAILVFERDESGIVIGLFWKWDHEGRPGWFQKRLDQP
ncbi:beta-lactamase/transpeptidase-like protein [Xylaria cf. heliscus]|nr:beta-lactamase/transpeptidase-like protein [Xylaria cf. heliscus]